MNRRDLLARFPVAVAAIVGLKAVEPNRDVTVVEMPYAVDGKLRFKTRTEDGVKHVIELDGRQLAEAVVPYIPDVVRRTSLI